MKNIFKKMALTGLIMLTATTVDARKGHIPDLNDSPLPAKPLQVSFNQHKPQYYKGELLWDDWLTLAWDGTRNRARIMADPSRPHDKFVRVTYPKAGVGPVQSGAQFLVHLPPTEQYWLTYRVRFQPGFDFRRGGKLPGLASGQGRYANGTLPRTGKGWTARLMWIENGELVPYLYYAGMPKESRWGHFWKMGSTVKPGQWHTITQYFRMNRNSQHNGSYGVWVDGRQLVLRHDMQWRFSNYGKIDSFLFSTYHGGSSAAWAPTRTSMADFDNVIISTQPPQYIQQQRARMAHRKQGAR